MSEPSNQQVLDLVQRWVEAERRGDVSALDGLLDPAFRLVGPFGFVLDRAAVLGRFQHGLHYDALTVGDHDLREYGDTAVVIAALSQQANFQGQDSSGPFRITLIAVRPAGHWQLASLHYSQKAQMPAGGPPQRSQG